MNFLALRAGESVFVDANIFIYDFGPDPVYGPACMALLRRIEMREIRGFTSSLVFHNVAHRAMTIEACQTFGWSYAGIARQMKRKPSEVSRLTRYRAALDNIRRIGVEVLAVSADHVALAADLSTHHGLLSGDALVVAMMQSNGLTNLASGDDDFERIPGIVRYEPI